MFHTWNNFSKGRAIERARNYLVKALLIAARVHRRVPEKAIVKKKGTYFCSGVYLRKRGFQPKYNLIVFQKIFIAI